MKKYIIALIPVTMLLLIFSLSTLTPEQLAYLPIPKGNNAHILAFFVWGTLMFFSMDCLSNFSTRKIIGIVVLLGILFGCFDEIIQMFTLHRNPDIWDVFRDFLGLCCSAIFCSLVKFFFKYTEKGEIE